MIHIKYNPIMFTSNVSTIYADGHKYVVARIEHELWDNYIIKVNEQWKKVYVQ